MTFELSWRRAPEDVARQAAADFEVFHDLVRLQHALVQSGGEGVEVIASIPPPRDPSRFEVNIWSMQVLRRVLDAAGVLVVDADPGEWPAVEFDEDGLPDDPAALDVFLSQSLEDDRLPDFKLCSNDGWIVTSEECVKVAEAVAQLEPDGFLRALDRPSITYQTEAELAVASFFAERAAAVPGLVLRGPERAAVSSRSSLEEIEGVVDLMFDFAEFCAAAALHDGFVVN